jgi:hypothetical protein
LIIIAFVDTCNKKIKDAEYDRKIESKRNKELTIPDKTTETKNESKRTYYQNYDIYEDRTTPWYEDQDTESIWWTDFLEEIENKGIMLDDPEAEEIWEQYK